MFRKERAAVTDAANTAKRSINTSLVIATLSLVVSLLAIFLAVIL